MENARERTGVSEETYRSKKDFFDKLNESYDHITQIRSGGGGIIYEAYHRRLGQKVVLKKIRSDKVGVIGSEREMKILMNLKHTYLPRIYDFWHYEDEVYTVMEFIEGESFQELLDEGRVFKEKDVIRWTRQLAEVLEYLHNSEQPIIHGDIKPANLMLTPRGDICLIDFNVSFLLGGSADPTIGYSEYYSPVEQLIRMELADPADPEYGARPAGRRDNGADPADREATEVLDAGRYERRTETAAGPADIRKTEMAAGPADIETTEVLSGEAGPSQTDIREFRARKAREMTEIYGKRLKVDERSDIYSACATMYHILTGRRPAPCYMSQVPAEEVLPSVNDAFSRILSRGMEQDPKKRYKNVSQMLTALRKLAKLTKSYKRLLRRQDFVLIVLLIVFLGSAGAAYAGWGMRTESALEEKLDTAREYYANGQYRDGVTYLEQNVLEDPLYQNSPRIGEGHYLAGGCYLELGDIAEAAGEYRRAIFLDDTQPAYYRDYGIALARGGNPQQAREALLQAQARGLETDGLKLLEGEIASLEGDYKGAEAALRECLADSEDDSVILRAALKLDEVLEAAGGEDAYPERIRMLEETRARLPKERLLMLLERITQVYGDYGQLAGDASATEKAILALSEIIDMGYGTLVEWLDKAVYLQSLGRYDEAEACLLEADGIYPDNYLIYKRLAFLQLEIPDYEAFDTYFQICDGLYQKRPSGAEQDMEMEYLYRIYEEAVLEGWLEG